MRLRNLLTGISLFFCTLIMAQDSGFSWGISLYPNSSGRRLVALGNYDEQFIRDIEALETTKFSYSTGLVAEWRAEKLGLRIGLNYMNSGYQTIRRDFGADEPNPQNASQIREQFENTYIETPIAFLFSHNLKEGSALFFMLGASLALNLTNQTNTILYFGETTQSERSATEGDFRPFNYAFQSGIGWTTNLGERFTLVVQPHFQFWLKGILEDNLVNRNLYSLGLKTAFMLNN
jgi:hypothetical protein